MSSYLRLAKRRNPVGTQRAKELRRSASPAEQIMWHELRQASKGRDFDFRRQYPVDPYIVDFACLKFKLIIEIDGASHDTRLEQDKRRDEFLKNLGYEILRFTNENVLTNRKGVVQTILAHIEELTEVFIPLP
jgi:BirA family biotin operon repressor/biotin-[acetyl-CoA-carboxylase] ligase